MKLWIKRLIMVAPLLAVVELEFFAHQLSGFKRDLTDLKRDNSKLRRLLEDQSHALQMLRDAVQHNRNMTSKEHDILMLRLENAMLSFERRLPSPRDERNA